MGTCCSKKEEPSFPTKIPSIDPSKQNDITVKKFETPLEAAELIKAAVSFTPHRTSSSAEEKKDKKARVSPVKQIAKLDEKGSKAVTSINTPLRTSSCSKEEVEAILIQCGRLSRNSSGKTISEMTGQRNPTGSKRSFDFDIDGKEEGEEIDKLPSSKPSPRRKPRSGSRERVSGEGRKLSRSPGRRSDGLGTSACEKPRKQPAKMISVPATEKSAIFCNDLADVRDPGAKVESAAMSITRSRSPPNNSRSSNDAPYSQPLSRSASRKANESPSRRNPMAEMDENSLRNQNGIATKGTSVVQSTAISRSPPNNNKNLNDVHQSLSRSSSRKESPSRRNPMSEIDENPLRHQNGANIGIVARSKAVGEKAKKNENTKVADAKVTTEVDRLNTRTLTRTLTCDHGSNIVLKPTSHASLMTEDLQIQQQSAPFSFATCVSKACSIPEADQSCKNSFPKDRLTRRLTMVQRETFIKSEDDLMKPSIHKFVTAMGEEPRESAGSNSFIGEPWISSWEPSSVDSTDRRFTSPSYNGNEVEVGDGVCRTVK